MQSKEQTFPSEGNKLIPRDIPNLLDFTGPNTGEGKIIVIIKSSVLFMYNTNI